MSPRDKFDDVAAAIRGLAEEVAALRREVAAVAEDARALRDRIDMQAAPSTRGRPVPKRREGRKRGLAAAMGRLFWDRMMQFFVEEIRRRGPMTAAQLHATLDADALEMAEAVFERIDVSLIAEKVDVRVQRGHYFTRTEDGRYDAL
ncbi:hypothetical protein [Methylobacterium aerolatum]|uniref:Uncharacterized protein n=1 Tax=Methylobacterium aerolatum TaxID=418708 RepID=A0ABU0HVJ3_9HYPH|nr:hypothetical protein [Methylobacterium aerolatum]MDQ0446359.1 hypothetical protein [Methylobacterium aerolatum]GJD37468.1 hypothetical protein FMGBMHLM_4400 [Methylobacterium aerolatum]